MVRIFYLTLLLIIIGIIGCDIATDPKEEDPFEYEDGTIAIRNESWEDINVEITDHSVTYISRRPKNIETKHLSKANGTIQKFIPYGQQVNLYNGQIVDGGGYTIDYSLNGKSYSTYGTVNGDIVFVIRTDGDSYVEYIDSVGTLQNPIIEFSNLSSIKNQIYIDEYSENCKAIEIIRRRNNFEYFQYENERKPYYIIYNPTRLFIDDSLFSNTEYYYSFRITDGNRYSEWSREKVVNTPEINFTIKYKFDFPDNISFNSNAEIIGVSDVKAQDFRCPPLIMWKYFDQNNCGEGELSNSVYNYYDESIGESIHNFYFNILNRVGTGAIYWLTLEIMNESYFYGPDTIKPNEYILFNEFDCWSDTTYILKPEN